MYNLTNIALTVQSNATHEGSVFDCDAHPYDMLKLHQQMFLKTLRRGGLKLRWF